MCALGFEKFFKYTCINAAYAEVNYGFFVLQENNVVPLIKFLSFLCVLLGFALLALRMEYQPSFTKNWFSIPLDQQLDMEPFDWGTESTKSIDAKREGNSGEYQKFREHVLDL